MAMASALSDAARLRGNVFSVLKVSSEFVQCVELSCKIILAQAIFVVCKIPHYLYRNSDALGFSLSSDLLRRIGLRKLHAGW